MLKRLRFFLADVRYGATRWRRRRQDTAQDASSTLPVETAPAAAPESGTPAELAETPAVATARAAAASSPPEPAGTKPEAEPQTDEIPALAAEPPGEPSRARRLLRRVRPRIRRPRMPRPRRRGPRRARPRRWRPSRRLLLGAALTLILVGAGVAAFLIVDPDFGDDEAPAPAPEVVVRTDQPPEEPPDLGFPAFATKNTTRIAGADSVADAAGAALAVFPSTGGVRGPDAVALVSEEDWSAGVAASVLAAEPTRAPVLLGEPGGVPEFTVDALVSLAPQGSPATGNTQVFQIGEVDAPDGLRAEAVRGDSAAEIAVEIEALRRELTGDDPRHVLLASADEPAFAMPAAAWAARSGDPVLFVQRNSVPSETLETLERYEDVPVYLIGPESAASDKVTDELDEAGIEVDRIAGEDPVENAIAFARFSAPDGFGWGITDPGHGLVIASAERPADAGAASALSASGKWGPLLLIERPDVLPPALEGFLLDIKPGYLDDPTRALYNHVWLIGDPGAIGVDVQAQIDELAELAQVESGGGAPEDAEPPAPQSESEAQDQDQSNR